MATSPFSADPVVRNQQLRYIQAVWNSQHPPLSPQQVRYIQGVWNATHPAVRAPTTAPHPAAAPPHPAAPHPAAAHPAAPHVGLTAQQTQYIETAFHNSAANIVKSLLDQYGLGALYTWAMQTYKAAGGGSAGTAAITAEMPQTPQFKARFPAYDQMAKEGRAMSPASMLSYEQTARQIMQANGIPAGFYDKPADFAQFMLNNVSTSELEQRVKDAQTIVINSPPDVRQQLDRLYGVDSGHLTAYFLDPKTAEPILQQRVTSTQIAAEAQRTAGDQLSRAQAEHLAQLGVTDTQAAAGFNKLGMEAGLFQAQQLGEKPIGLDQQLAAQFDQNAQAALAFQQRQSARKAEFQGDAGLTVDKTGIAALQPTQRGV